MKHNIPSVPPLILAAAMSVACLSPLQSSDWPQWRGPDRNEVSPETGLLKAWPEGGPEREWVFREAGLGYSSPSVVGDRLYVLGARGPEEYLIALDVSGPRELWATSIGVFLNNSWGDGPRSTPTVDGDRVYALGGRGDLICVDTADGRVVWRKAMRSLGGAVPNWGYAESILVDGDRVVCTPGGSDGSIVALNKETGDVIWQSGGLTDSAHYSSIIAADVHGERQYIQLFEKRLAGVSAADGSPRWQVDWPGRTAVIPTPVVHENHVYVTSGYDVGCMLVRIDRGNEVSQVYRNNVMENHHGGVVLLEGHIYGYSDSEGWTCQNFMTGEAVWSERGALGKGTLTYADGRLYCLEENSGTMVLAEASTSGWEEHGRFKLEAQSDRRSPRGKIWTHPVISGGRLYLRDQELISRYVLKP